MVNDDISWQQKIEKERKEIVKEIPPQWEIERGDEKKKERNVKRKCLKRPNERLRWPEKERKKETEIYSEKRSLLQFEFETEFSN